MRQASSVPHLRAMSVEPLTTEIFDWAEQQHTWSSERIADMAPDVSS